MVMSELEARLIAQEAKRTRDLFQTTLSSIGDGLIATDAAGKVTFVNKTAQVISGFEEHEALDKPIDEIVTLVREDAMEPVENPIIRALRDGLVVGLTNHTVLIANGGPACSDRRQRSPDPEFRRPHRRRCSRLS
jgi:PAS domain S-box-containing protein